MVRLLALPFGLAIVASIATNGNKVAILATFFGFLAVYSWLLLSGKSALRCPFCSKRVKLGATHCHHCGRYVGAVEPAAPPAPDPAAEASPAPAAAAPGVFYCSRCGASVAADARFCSGCGEPVAAFLSV